MRSIDIGNLDQARAFADASSRYAGISTDQNWVLENHGRLFVHRKQVVGGYVLPRTPMGVELLPSEVVIPDRACELAAFWVRGDLPHPLQRKALREACRHACRRGSGAVYVVTMQPALDHLLSWALPDRLYEGPSTHEEVPWIAVRAATPQPVHRRVFRWVRQWRLRADPPARRRLTARDRRVA
jgi:hypothetical protein